MPFGESPLISTFALLPISSIKALTIASTTYNGPNLFDTGVFLQPLIKILTNLSSSSTWDKKKSFRFLILEPETPGAFKVLISFSVFSKSPTDSNIVCVFVFVCDF